MMKAKIIMPNSRVETYQCVLLDVINVDKYNNASIVHDNAMKGVTDNSVLNGRIEHFTPTG